MVKVNSISLYQTFDSLKKQISKTDLCILGSSVIIIQFTKSIKNQFISKEIDKFLSEDNFNENEKKILQIDGGSKIKDENQVKDTLKFFLDFLKKNPSLDLSTEYPHFDQLKKIKKKLYICMMKETTLENIPSHGKYFTISIMYLLSYLPIIYFPIKLFFNYKQYTNCNTMTIIAISQALTIATEIILKHASKQDASQWWENIDQKYISILYSILTASLIYKFKK